MASRRESSNIEGLFAPLVQNLAQQKPFERLKKGTVNIGRDPRTGKLTLRYQNPDQVKQENELEQIRETSRLSEAGAMERLRATQAGDQQGALEKLLFESQLKQANPDAKEQAYRKLFELSGLPEPTVTTSPLASPEQRNRLETLRTERMGERTRETDALLELVGGGQNEQKPLIVFDPNTGKYYNMNGEEVTSIPRGSPTRNLPLRPETVEPISAARARGTASGQRETPERAQAATAIDSMLDSIDQMEQFLTEDPTRLAKSKLPFTEREFAAIIDQFDKEAAIAAGGKQLTQTELTLIRRTRPTVQDMFSPEAIQRKVSKLRQIGQAARARLQRVPGQTSTSPEVEAEKARLRAKYGR